MLEYTIDEAESHLPPSVREAEAGQHVALTRRSKPAATLISTARHKEVTSVGSCFWDAFQSSRGEYHLAALKIEPDQVYQNVRDRIARRDLRIRKRLPVFDGRIAAIVKSNDLAPVAADRIDSSRLEVSMGKTKAETEAPEERDDGWPVSATRSRVSPGHGICLALDGPG